MGHRLSKSVRVFKAALGISANRAEDKLPKALLNDLVEYAPKACARIAKDLGIKYGGVKQVRGYPESSVTLLYGKDLQIRIDLSDWTGWE